jgi:hypothetical protein
MKEAVREGWTTARLERSVQADRRQRRPHVGRKPRVPADPTEPLLALDALGDKFMRWCEVAQADLPAGLRPLVERRPRPWAKRGNASLNCSPASRAVGPRQPNRASKTTEAMARTMPTAS